jgi:hypothetical protein
VDVDYQGTPSVLNLGLSPDARPLGRAWRVNGELIGRQEGTITLSADARMTQDPSFWTAQRDVRLLLLIDRQTCLSGQPGLERLVQTRSKPIDPQGATSL